MQTVNHPNTTPLKRQCQRDPFLYNVANWYLIYPLDILHYVFSDLTEFSRIIINSNLRINKTNTAVSPITAKNFPSTKDRQLHIHF